MQFRQAKVVDAHAPGEKPVVNRPPVPQEMVRDILNYLYRAPVVHTKPGALPDIFVPGPPNVPDAFHTDGTWIWPAAVPHYLRKYGVPPEAGLLEHIKANNFRVPYVDPQLRATAQADVLGAPRPPQTVDDAGELDPVSRVERGEEPERPLRASEVLRTLRARLAEHGVAASAYRIGEIADGAWCLHRTPQGWEVARYVEGRPVEPRYFQRVQPAAEALLGALLFFPGRARAGVDEEAEAQEPPAHATDWPILPLRGEPPLPLYRGKRLPRCPRARWWIVTAMRRATSCTRRTPRSRRPRCRSSASSNGTVTGWFGPSGYSAVCCAPGGRYAAGAWDTCCRGRSGITWKAVRSSGCPEHSKRCFETLGGPVGSERALEVDGGRMSSEDYFSRCPSAPESPEADSEDSAGSDESETLDSGTSIPCSAAHRSSSATASSRPSGPRSSRSSFRCFHAFPTIGPGSTPRMRMISLPSRSGRTFARSSSFAIRSMRCSGRRRRAATRRPCAVAVVQSATSLCSFGSNSPRR